jgi:sec-independent protein translocase protein TatB
MFNIGFGELAIICIVLIIAVGPERLPSMMKTLGKTMRTLRNASRDIRASTGIDELLREDFDLMAPPRRPISPVVPAPAVTDPAPVARSEDVQPAASPNLGLPEAAPVQHEPVPNHPAPEAPAVSPTGALPTGAAGPHEPNVPASSAEHPGPTDPTKLHGG